MRHKTAAQRAAAMPNPKHRLTEEQRQALLARLRAGESGAALAREFGVTRQAVCFLRQHRDYREGVSDKPPSGKRPPKMKLNDEQWQLIRHSLRESKPADHGLHRIGDDPQSRWNLERALELARLLTGRKPSKSRMKLVLAEEAPRPAPWTGYPQPPTRLTPDTLSESQRADPQLAAYLLSDIYWTIQQREYALALQQANRLGHHAPPPQGQIAARPSTRPAQAKSIPAPPAAPVPGQRSGKHKGNRNPATKSKRKRKRTRR